MTRSTAPSAVGRLALGISGKSRSALRFMVLAVALVSYGSMPSTAVMQTEVEAQLHEMAQSSADFDLRTKLRGAAHRRAGAAIIASGHFGDNAMAAAAGANPLGHRLSLGVSLPLRC